MEGNSIITLGTLRHSMVNNNSLRARYARMFQSLIKKQKNKQSNTEQKLTTIKNMKTSFQAQIEELAAAYKKASKVELANDVEKKCEGDMKTLILGKLGRG